ncbi:TetR/AcrR family transcriptional regulator [Sessilibacter corallicola]|uniref:TetR/AcrR family transcriptional regulator n=1 Tax=Sessilibacter corallicola TaxID=2904075 RepID=A0ABQ0A8E7_9GAMM
MSTETKPYHHGDLRQTLLDVANDIIAEGGVESLSIRKLAERASVSRTAPYHHFKDKNALLCAIAEQGFLNQNRLVSLAVKETDALSPAQAFEHYVLAYLRFAEQEQQTYDLMYGREIWKTGEVSDSLKDIAHNSFKVWLHWINELQKQGLFNQQLPSLRVAQASWASLHGLCRLFIDGVYVNREEFEDIAKTTVQLLIHQHK